MNNTPFVYAVQGAYLHPLHPKSHRPCTILFGALQVTNCQPIDLDIDTPIEDQMCSETKLLRVSYNTVESIQLSQNLFNFWTTIISYMKILKNIFKSQW